MNSNEILNLHSTIMEKFKQEQEKLEFLNKIKYSIQNLTQEPSSILKTIDTSIKNQDLENKFCFYQLEIIPLIEKYKTELNKPIVVSFMKNTSITTNKEIINLETEIKNTIKSFGFDTFVNNNEIIDENIKCSLCNKLMDTIYKNMLVCSSCGLEKDVFFSFSHKDIERINIITKYTYDRRIHFRDCINQYQGKQNSSISQELYENIIQCLTTHNLIDMTKKTKKDKFKRVSKKHVYLFLKECGYSKHYEDLNLIYHKITDKELPDISHLEEVLMKDFDTLSLLYDKKYIKTQKISRKNFINTQYILFQLLNRHKFICNREDFIFLKTTERKHFHNTICSELFKELGWNFTDVF